MLLGFSDSRFW